VPLLEIEAIAQISAFKQLDSERHQTYPPAEIESHWSLKFNGRIEKVRR
jgi:hypothetical protein